MEFKRDAAWGEGDMPGSSTGFREESFAVRPRKLP